MHLVFGARQTGKSTLLRKQRPEAAVWMDFSRPAERTEYLRDSDLLVQRCRALPKSRRPTTVVVDEAQNVPANFDAEPHLYDSNTRRWRFVSCGSSARKLRVTGANLLPGRSFLHHLYPLVLVECPPGGTGKMRAETPLPMPTRGAVVSRHRPDRATNVRRAARRGDRRPCSSRRAATRAAGPRWTAGSPASSSASRACSR